jgi:hypothetical protein
MRGKRLPLVDGENGAGNIRNIRGEYVPYVWQQSTWPSFSWDEGFRNALVHPPRSVWGIQPAALDQ